LYFFLSFIKFSQDKQSLTKVPKSSYLPGANIRSPQ
jgi:hypothetical protein